MSTYLDDFMEKMSTIPNDVNRYLRLIRNLDRRVDELQAQLVPQQNKFVTAIKELKDRKISELTPALKAQLESITKKQAQIEGYNKQKVQIASQMASLVQQQKDNLSNEVKQKLKDKTEEQINRKRKMKLDASKLNVGGKKQQFYYDPKESTYCYCGRTSFGEMVMCENPYCEREWFHIVCLQQKNLPEKWYCQDCQKQKEKTRNPVSRGFLIVQKDA